MALNELLARVDTLRAQVDALRPLDPDQEARLVQKLNLEWNYHSNAIEGNTLTLGETRAFLLYGITAQGKPFRDYLDIKGHNEAIRYLEDLVRGGEVLTEALIRELHRILLVEAYDVDAVTPDGRPRGAASRLAVTRRPQITSALPRVRRTSTPRLRKRPR